MTILENEAEYELIRDSGKVVREVFRVLETMIKPGVRTSELDSVAEEIIRDNGARPAFKGYHGYPSTICASVDNAVVHGIPSERMVLRDGSLVSIDVGVEKGGFFADSAHTFVLGEISEIARQLVEATKKCLDVAVGKAVSGGHIEDISAVVQEIASACGFQEVRMFVGHGIGRELHESPEVPNWGTPGKGTLLVEGLTLAIEPMLNEGTREIEILEDNWTAVTKDGKLSAHFEHTVIVRPGKPEIVT